MVTGFGRTGTWFGMEQGVSPPLESPEEPYLAYGLYLWRVVLGYQLFSPLKTEQNARDTFVAHVYELSPRPISTA